MANLTGIIDTTSPGKVIDAWHEANHLPRVRLGLSEVGHPCSRYLWYRHHGYVPPTPPGRVLRLFELGNKIEDMVVDDLTRAGYTVRDQQQELFFEDGGIKLFGHTDGIIEGLIESKQPHLLEIKTAKDSEFKKLLKLRYQKWQPKYKGQIHVYMLGLNLKRCLAVVYNKNTSEIYTERIKIDREYAVELLVDVFRAIQGDIPGRKCPSAAWYERRFCNYGDECF